MVAITLTFNINPELSLVDNVKVLLKRTSLSALEFFTTESETKEPGHVYTLSGLSMLGKPSYVDARLRPLCKLLSTYMCQFADGDDSYEEKLCQLEEVKYLIQEYRIEHKPHSSYFVDATEPFLLHIKDETTIEVTLNQIELKAEHLIEINEHLTVRDKHFLMLLERTSLLQHRLKIQQSRIHIESSGNDEAKTLQLLEVWIALEGVGFLDHIPSKDRGVIIPELRRRFFGIFQQSEVDYKRLRSRLMERKYSSPDILPRMVEAFKAAIRKKVK